jgi:hypothetical protein
MSGVTDRPELRDAARAFIAGALEALREEHVIPTPAYHRCVAVGRDYFGDTIRGVRRSKTSSGSSTRPTPSASPGSCRALTPIRSSKKGRGRLLVRKKRQVLRTRRPTGLDLATLIGPRFAVKQAATALSLSPSPPAEWCRGI